MPSSVRAYARFDADRLAQAIEAKRVESAELLGNGVLALTIDQGAHMQRYQGIVELSGASLEAVAEPISASPSRSRPRLRLAVARIARRQDGGGFSQGWRAGGLIAQFLPEGPERMRMADLPGGDAPEGAEVEA